MEQKKIETRPWDPAEHFETEEDMTAWLDAALEDGDPALVVAALGDMARAKGMTQKSGQENQSIMAQVATVEAIADIE